MSDDIELGLLSGSSSNASSTQTLFDRSKVHPGYGARKLPLGFSAGAVGAGQNYQHIFEGQLGEAAAQSDIFGIKAKYSQQLEAERILAEEVKRGNVLLGNQIKPSNLNWNKNTRKQYPEHWKQVKLWKERHNIKSGITLPFSKNIGPGNTIQDPNTRSDSIAGGHDLHYQYAKTNQDIINADREAISHFAYEAVNPEDPISQIQAGIGAVGLTGKNIVETLSGKVYYGNYVFTLS